MGDNSERIIDAIRCNAGLLEGCDYASMLAKKMGIPSPRIPRRRRWPWDRVREWLWNRRFRKALERALPIELRPLLLKPLFAVEARDINKLRLALDMEWQAFCALPAATEKEVDEWLADRHLSPDVEKKVRDMVQGSKQALTSDTQPISAQRGIPEHEEL